MNSKSLNPSPLRKFIITSGISLLVLVAAVGIFALMLSKQSRPLKTERVQPLTAVQAIHVRKTNYQEEISAYGQAKALKNTIVEAEIAGVVIWISPKLKGGAKVQKGEILVKLGPKDFLVAKNRAQANLNQSLIIEKQFEEEKTFVHKQIELAEKEVLAAHRELKRFQKLEKTQKASRSEVDRLKIQTAVSERTLLSFKRQKANINNSLDRVKSEIELKTTQLEDAVNNLKRTKVYAPYSGRIETRLIHEGAMANRGVGLFQIVDPNMIEIGFAVGASHFGEITTESAASLRLRKEDRSLWKGKIVRISPTINSKDRTFQVYVEIKKKKGTSMPFPPGAFVLAKIQGKLHKNIFVLPRAAFLEDTIFVIEDKTSQKKEAVVRSRQFKNHIFLGDIALIDSGLEEGEMIVTSGVEDIADESRVTIVSSTQSNLQYPLKTNLIKEDAL